MDNMITQQYKNATEKEFFVIVLFIIGHTRNRAQGTPEKKAENRIFRADAKRFYVENGNRKQLHLLNEWQEGNEAQGRAFCPQNGGHVP